MTTNDHIHQRAHEAQELTGEEQSLLESLDRFGASDRDALSSSELEAMASAAWSASAPRRSPLRLGASIAAVCMAGVATWIALGPAQHGSAPQLDEERMALAETMPGVDPATDAELESDVAVITTVAFGDEFAAELEAFDAELGEFELFGLPGDDFTFEGSL
ncbi:MAG: hypothetical protein AAGG07_03735 [Planctomycetota bacterium]